MNIEKGSSLQQAAHDILGRYNQDKINGFTDHILDRMIELVNPAKAKSVLDAMAGDGNLTLRFSNYCDRNTLNLPAITLLEYSQVQVEFARKELSSIPAEIIWGDVVSMCNLSTGKKLDDCSFDRVMIKSGIHEIPLEKHLSMYENIYRVLEPGGLFINLGFLFDDLQERDEFREITRVKDKLIGMHSAVINRHFSTHEEFYSRLKQIGFVDIHCGEPIEYSIQTHIAMHEFCKNEEEALQTDVEVQSAQARAMTLRRNGRIRFYGDRSVMSIPGEITIARRPTWIESNKLAFCHCAYDFLRNLECYNDLRKNITSLIPQGCSVLDMGCGPGLLAEALIEKDVRYNGFDISPDFIGKCRERFKDKPRFSFDVADIMSAEIGTELYDAITIINVLYLPGINPIHVLKKAFNALRKGGCLIVSGPTQVDSFRKAEPYMRAQLEKDGYFKNPESKMAFETVCEANRRLLPTEGNYWSVEGMIELLRVLGFKIDNTVYKDIYYGYGYMVMVEK